MLAEGDKAPNFTLMSDDENEVSLNDYLGKKVVLYFYPKDGTPGCTQEAKDFRDLYGVWKNKRFYGKTFLGIERTSFLIDAKGIIKKIYHKVKHKGHAQACLMDFSDNK